MPIKNYIQGDDLYNIARKILQNQAAAEQFISGEELVSIFRKILINQAASANAPSGSSPAPTEANVEYAALTADRTLTAADKPYLSLTPNASGRKVILPATPPATNTFFLRNKSTAFTFDVYQSDGTTLILTVNDGVLYVPFTYDSEDGLWF